MIDLISKQKAIDEIKERDPGCWEDAVYIVEHLPSVEPEIIKCKDCKWWQAVQNCNIDCNKEELIKALAYDRDQYEKGFKEGKLEAIRNWNNLYNYINDMALGIAPDGRHEGTEYLIRQTKYETLTAIIVVMLEMEDNIKCQ